MKTTSLVSTTALLAWMLTGLPSGAQEPVAPATAAGSDTTVAPVSANSKVRIVRLSEVKGEVLLDRLSGKGFEATMANLPITEGAKLKTGNRVAEVEFEDNSTLRVGMNSLVEFPQLELLASGAKASAVTVLQGTAYVNLMNTKGNEFRVKFGQQTVNLPPDSHIRLQLTQNEANLAVMHGEVVVDQPSGSTTVGKNKTASFNLAAQPSQPAIAKSVAEQPLDSWDQNAVQYHKSFANATSFGNNPYSYGINDMNYYGSFSNAGGCGSMWRPYFTSASWDPYGSGAWAYYPSAGYSWVSPYPWGWTPYHYGSWNFCQGVGWGWQPGGTWMGLANNSFVSPATSSAAGILKPHPPVHAPTSMESSLVGVNLKAMPASSLGDHDTFVFRGNSAGLGVPRGALGKLNSFSNQASQHGMASTPVYYGGARSAAEGGARGEAASASGYAASSRSYSSASQSGMSSAGSHASAPSAGASSSGGGSRR
jgi:FecR protein